MHCNDYEFIFLVRDILKLLYGINASTMQRQARSPLSRVLIVCPTHCNSSRLHLFVATFVQIKQAVDVMIFAVLFDMSIKCVHDTAFITTHNLCMGVCAAWITILPQS